MDNSPKVIGTAVGMIKLVLKKCAKNVPVWVVKAGLVSWVGPHKERERERERAVLDFIPFKLLFF